MSKVIEILQNSEKNGSISDAILCKLRVSQKENIITPLKSAEGRHGLEQKLSENNRNRKILNL